VDEANLLKEPAGRERKLVKGRLSYSWNRNKS
jgi:hypothetical protein